MLQRHIIIHTLDCFFWLIICVRKHFFCESVYSGGIEQHKRADITDAVGIAEKPIVYTKLADAVNKKLKRDWDTGSSDRINRKKCAFRWNLHLAWDLLQIKSHQYCKKCFHTAKGITITCIWGIWGSIVMRWFWPFLFGQLTVDVFTPQLQQLTCSVPRFRRHKKSMWLADGTNNVRVRRHHTGYWNTAMNRKCFWLIGELWELDLFDLRGH